MASYPTQYLYAIVDGLPRAWRPPAGVDDGRVATRALDSVSVVLGDIVAVPPANPRTLARHHDVVASALEAEALLPFRYGVAVPGAELGAWLAGRREAIAAALASRAVGVAVVPTGPWPAYAFAPGLERRDAGAERRAG